MIHKENCPIITILINCNKQRWIIEKKSLRNINDKQRKVSHNNNFNKLQQREIDIREKITPEYLF